MTRVIVDIGDIIFEFMDVLHEAMGYVSIMYIGGKDPEDTETIQCK